MTRPVRVQLRRTRGYRKPAGAIVVTRSTRWGNPFRVEDYAAAGHPDPVGAALGDHRRWLDGSPDYPDTYTTAGGITLDRRWQRDHLADLAGATLACYCPADARCHADVLAELAQTVPHHDGAA